MTNETAPSGTISVAERRIAYMVAAIVGLSLLSIIVDIIALAAGVDTGKEPWTTLWVFPGVGLPIGFLLMIALLIVGTRRRMRDNRAAAEAVSVEPAAPTASATPAAKAAPAKKPAQRTQPRKAKR